MKLKKWFPWTGRTLAASAYLLGTSAWAEEVKQAATAGDPTTVYRTVGLGAAAAFAVAVSIIGASYAVGRIGSAAVGALVEKPELLPRTILFVALAEGLAVLGFAFAMILLQKI
jgi:V/A-type H+-transporting ATPase subunit K